MITLAELIERFEPALLQRYGERLLPSQFKALWALKGCRTRFALRMLAACEACGEQRSVPHSCGHRACPHCQHHESQRWLERQLGALVAAPYFLVTFTLPAELRGLAWAHQRVVYALLMQCAWDTLDTFARNDAKLRATPGAVGVLHTHSRRLEFHPHVHMVMPAAALDAQRRLWRTKSRRGLCAGGAASKPPGQGYLFNHKALAKVFRAKVLDAIERAGLPLPGALPQTWVVDCKGVGDGHKALVYLGRYLYRGVIQEADILRCEDGQVSFRYRDAKTGKAGVRALPGADFLWLVLQHVLPKGLRRSRNFGFLHHNSIATVRLLQVLQMPNLRGALAGVAASSSAPSPLPARPVWRCVCGQPMHVVQRRMPARPNDVNDVNDVEGRMRTPPDVPAGKPVRPAKPDKPEPASARTMH